MEARLEQIRRAEAHSHIEAYTAHSLYSPGSWLAKPIKTVLELLPLFDNYTEFHGLDLGSGVGRNSIALAQYLKNIPCQIDCVDILELAIEKLLENAKKYQVADQIRGIYCPIDEYCIQNNDYDMIMAVSALEHMESPAVFERKLTEIRDGLRAGGIACLIVNSGVVEHEKDTGKKVDPQFEVNLPTEQMTRLLTETFTGWEILKHTIVHQKYDIPRQWGLSALETDVVTLVAKKVMNEETP